MAACKVFEAVLSACEPSITDLHRGADANPRLVQRRRMGVEERERDRLLSKVADGKELEFTSAAGGAAASALGGLTFQPAKPGARLPGASSAAALAGLTQQARLASASLWASLQGAPRLPGVAAAGLSSALAVLADGALDGLSLDGYADLAPPRRAGAAALVSAAGVDWSVAFHPRRGLSGGLELCCDVAPPAPRRPVTLRYRADATHPPPLSLAAATAQQQAAAGVGHSASVSVPVAAGGAALRLAAARQPARAAAAGGKRTLSVELARRGAGGEGGGARRRKGGGAAAAAGDGGSTDSDSDGEPPARRPASRVPALRLEAISVGDAPRELAASWRQAWGPRLRTSAAYRTSAQHPAGQLTADVRARLAPLVEIAGGAAAAAGPAPALRRASAKLVVRGRSGAARHRLTLEAAYAPPPAGGPPLGGVTHKAAFRRHGRRGVHAALGGSLSAGPAGRALQAEIDLPL